MPPHSANPRSARALALGCLTGLLALVSACGKEAPSVTLTFNALGDTVDIRLVRVEPSKAEQAAEIIRHDFDNLEQDLSTWAGGSMSRETRASSPARPTIGTGSTTASPTITSSIPAPAGQPVAASPSP
jgi:hypothetical protein